MKHKNRQVNMHVQFPYWKVKRKKLIHLFFSARCENVSKSVHRSKRKTIKINISHNNCTLGFKNSYPPLIKPVTGLKAMDDINTNNKRDGAHEDHTFRCEELFHAKYTLKKVHNWPFYPRIYPVNRFRAKKS